MRTAWQQTVYSCMYIGDHHECIDFCCYSHMFVCMSILPMYYVHGLILDPILYIHMHTCMHMHITDYVASYSDISVNITLSFTYCYNFYIILAIAILVLLAFVYNHNLLTSSMLIE